MSQRSTRPSDAAFNVAEVSLVHEEKSEVLKRVKFANKVDGRNDQSMIVMQFIRFLVSDISIDEMTIKIEQLPQDMKFTWKYLAVLNGLTDHTVQRLDRIGCINGFSDVPWIAKKCIQVIPII